MKAKYSKEEKKQIRENGFTDVESKEILSHQKDFLKWLENNHTTSTKIKLN